MRFPGSPRWTAVAIDAWAALAVLHIIVWAVVAAVLRFR
jgi:hypothetical protein